MSAKHFLYLLTACVLFCFFYSPAQLYFLSDDWDSLLFSLHFANIVHSYRPLSDASLYFDYSIWKLHATGFHFTNFILHFACVFCVYFFSKTIFGLRNNNIVSSRLALLSSLLFLWYPFHSEALFWIVGRGAVLCTLFSLLCFIFYVKRNKSAWYYVLSLLCFVFALLSYEEAWILPLLIVVITWITKQKNKPASLLYAAGFWVTFIIYLFVRNIFTKDFIGTPYGSERMIDFNFFIWCKNAAALAARSVVLPMQSSLLFITICAMVAFVFIALLIFIRKQINLVVLISSVCFLLSLLPVIPLGINTHNTESERFLYFPSLFLTIFVAQLLAFIPQKIWFLTVIFIVGMVALRQSYNSFAVSSAVSRTTVSALYKTGVADTIVCNQLPGQYKGAFIFRNGFESAVKLIKKDSTIHVVILSRSDFFYPVKNYSADLINASLNHNKNKLQIYWQDDKVVFRK